MVAIGLAAFTSELLPVVALSVALLNEFAMSIPIPALECITGSYSWLRRVISSIIILVSVLAAAWAGERALSRAKNRAANVEIYARNLGRQMQVRRLLAQFLIVAFPVVMFLLGRLTCTTQ